MANKTKKESVFSKIFSIDEMGVIIPLIAIILLTEIVLFLKGSDGHFVSANNLLGMYQTIPFIVVIALGAAFPLMTGNVDISTGRVAGLGGIITALLASQHGLHWIPCVLISLVICAVVGFINGLLVVKLNIPDFIATMATLNICGAVRYIILPKGIIDIPLTGLDNFKVANIGGAWNILGLQYQFWVMIIFLIIAYFMIKKTMWGRRMLAVGDNREVAAMAGINVSSMRLQAYVISACLACISGVLTTISYQKGIPAIGDGWEFKAIAGCVVGGVSLSGGKASALGIFLGVSLIWIAQSALIFIGLPTILNAAVQGVVMAAAVMYETLRERRKIKA